MADGARGLQLMTTLGATTPRSWILCLFFCCPVEAILASGVERSSCRPAAKGMGCI